MNGDSVLVVARGDTYPIGGSRRLSPTRSMGQLFCRQKLYYIVLYDLVNDNNY